MSMKWSNLSKNKCPQCGVDLADKFDNARKMFVCTCGFTITTKRFAEIVRDKTEKQIGRDFDT